jgi:hypothetical protein
VHADEEDNGGKAVYATEGMHILIDAHAMTQVMMGLHALANTNPYMYAHVYTFM